LIDLIPDRPDHSSRIPCWAHSCQRRECPMLLLLQSYSYLITYLYCCISMQMSSLPSHSFLSGFSHHARSLFVTEFITLECVSDVLILRICPMSGSFLGALSATSEISMAALVLSKWPSNESLFQSRTVSCTRNNHSHLRCLSPARTRHTLDRVMTRDHSVKW
jgi:hypothetical protein